MITSPQENALIGRIDAVAPGAYAQLADVSTFDEEQARRIACVILQACCAAQHVGSILAGRKAFKQLPVAWTKVNLQSVVGEAVDLTDAWEFRRFLELLHESNSEMLRGYVAAGLSSNDPEICEIACEFANQES
ncbi:MAG: hypothetical protein U0271_15005 [Polyangiaceae bacterium]